MREQHYPSGARHMPIENDFTRVFGAIKELEARVQSLEVRSRLDKWNVFVEQEVTPIPTSEWPKTTKPAEHVEDFIKDLPQSHAPRVPPIYATESFTPKAGDTVTVDYGSLVERMKAETLIDNDEATVDLDDWLELISDYETLDRKTRRLEESNNQLRFILSILAAVKDDGWIEWHGGERPVGGNAKVDVRFRDGSTSVNRTPYGLRWYNMDHHCDIIAYRIAR